jgi:hypothetical protein
MSMVDWAKQELDLLLTGEEDKDGMQQHINNNILELMEVLCNQGHSGFSVGYAVNSFTRLAKGLPLKPLTGKEDEWNEGYTNSDGTLVQQNKRCSKIFRHNKDNSTAINIEGRTFSDDGGRTFWHSKGSRVPVTFPYHVPDKPEQVITNKDLKEEN